MRKGDGSRKNSRSAASTRDKSGRFLKGTHWRPHAVFHERDYLIQAYVVEKRSASDIAKLHGVTDGAILYWLRRWKIATRDVSSARAAKKWGSRGAKNPMYGRCGAKNPRWIDGSAPERQTMYARSFWKELVKAVYARDEYKCLRCNDSHGVTNRLHAHHVKPWAGNKASRFDLDNIITLCNRCHNWVHSKANVASEYLSR